MTGVRCVNCGKPRTNDPTCPRCGSEWDRVTVSVRDLIDSAIDVKVNGHGVVRRNGEIVQQMRGEQL